MTAEPGGLTGPGDVEARLRSLLRANGSIVGELSLAAVLRRIVDAARDLLGVEYGALGVIAPQRRGLEEFVHSGVGDDQVALIGHLPHGQGLLGALIEDPRAIRLRVLGEDARSVGFPEHHPPMASFLGVPVRVREEVFGNLYLCGTRPRDFSDDDVEVVTSLAATAGIAIENARLFDESRRRQAWLEQTSALTRELLSAPRDDALQRVSRVVQRLARADRVAVHVADESGGTLIAAKTGPVHAEATQPGSTADDEADHEAGDEAVLAAWVLQTGTALRRDEEGELESAGAGGTVPPQVASPGERALLVVPLVGSGPAHGALVVTRAAGERGFAPGDVEMATTFAGQVSLALEVAERRRDQARIELLEDRARIARDLHDHVIQQLFAAGMTVQGVTASLGGGTEASMLDGVVDLIDEAVGQIRTSIFHLRAQPRDHGGLRATVLETVREVRTGLGVEPHVRFEGPVDVLSDPELVQDVRAVVREALSNVARHAAAGSVHVTIHAGASDLGVVVTDDGSGLTDTGRHSGLANLGDRARRRGGALTMEAPPRGTGTVLRWQVPAPTH